MKMVVRELPPGRLASARSYNAWETDFGSGYIDFTFRQHANQEWSSCQRRLRLLLGDPFENRRDVAAEPYGVLAHREMTEPFHDDDFGAVDAGRGAQRILRRAGEVVLAGQQEQ